MTNFENRSTDLVTTLVCQQQIIKKLECSIIEERFPYQKWTTSDLAALQSVASVCVSKNIQDAAWSEIVGMLVPFIYFICEQSSVKKIGVVSQQKCVDIVLSDYSFSSVNTIVDSYCDWQDRNSETPFFNINIVGELEFNANSYIVTVVPKR